MMSSWWQALALRKMVRAANQARRPQLRVEPLESRDTPTGILAVGADPGSAPVVTVYDATSHSQLFTITAYDTSYTGGVNVAVGDVNGDGTPDVITGTGAGGGPVVNVYNGSDGTLLKTFTAGDADSRAGVSVAAADFDKDGSADIVVGTMQNGQPLVQVLRYSDLTALHEFTPFQGATAVNVAAGDVNGDGTPDVIAAAGSGGGPVVTVFDGSSGATLMNVFTFEDTFTGGVLVSASDLNGDGYADVITSAGTGGGPRVQVLSGKTSASLQNFFAYSEDLRDGTRAAGYDANADGSTDLVTCDGIGQSNELKAFDGKTLAELTAPTFAGLPIAVVTAPGADKTAPTVALTATASAFNTSPFTVTATFSKTVTGFDVSDVTVTNGTASNFTAVDGKTYTFQITPTAEGTVTVGVAAGAATDAAGNANTAATDLSVAYDTTAPVPTISSTASEPTTTKPIPFTVTFSETVTGFDVSDLTVTNGTASNFVAASGSSYTFDVTPTADGAVTVSVAAGVATDAAGNGNAASETLTRTFNGAIALTANSLSTNVTTPTLTGTVDDSTATVTVVVGGQTITATVSGNDWSAPVPTALAQGTYDIQVSASNADGGTGSLTVTGGLVIDLTAPTVSSITTATPGPTNATVTYTVTFSEPVVSANVDVGDFIATVASGSFATAPTVASVTPVTSGDHSASFTVQVNPGSGEGTVRLDVAATATAADPAGNALSVPAGGFVSGDVVQVDTVAPTADVTSTAPDPTAANPIPFTVTFSETVTGFAATDVVVTNGAVINFVAVDGKTYTFGVVPNGAGSVGVSVPVGAASDAAGNSNSLATASRTFNGTVTTAAVTTTAANPTNAGTIPVTVTFSGGVTGFDASDVVVANGSASNFAAVSGTTYTFDVTPGADGTVTVTVPAASATDGAGTPTAAGTLSVVVDRTAPVPFVGGPTATNSSTITFNIGFSEAVTGFDQTGITVTNGSVTNFTATDAKTYTVAVAPTANGTVTLAVHAGSAADAAGNTVAAAVSGSVVYDTTAPTATVSSTASEPTSTTPIPFTVTFSEDVTGFDVSDVTVSNGTASNFAATSGSVYTFDVTPTAQGSVSVSVAAGGATDAAGNANTAGAAVSRTFNGTVTVGAEGMTDTMPDVNAAQWQTQADGLKIWDVQTGSGTAVTSASTLSVYYTGWLAADGTQFESNRTDSPASFALTSLIEGWKEGLVGMQPGGIRRLSIPAALAYGSSGSGSTIPANADLVFEIKLVSTT